MTNRHEQARTTTVHRFLQGDGGSVSITATLALVPLVLAAGIAIDYGRALTAKSELQAATDSAALAGAAMSGGEATTNGARQSMATKVLTANAQALVDENGIQKTVSFGEKTITVQASTQVPTTLMKLVKPYVEVTATSTAKYSTGASTSAPLCLLALNAAAPETFKAWGTADLIAPDCAVQSHSISLQGMATGGSATATAKHFCSAGAHTGTGFTPTVEDNCKPANDPYAGKYTAKALQDVGINVNAACNQTTSLSLKQQTVTFDAGGPLNTYVFCSGLTMGAGAIANFQPGVYVFHGHVNVGSGATINAPAGVTFYFSTGGVIYKPVVETEFDDGYIVAETDDVTSLEGSITVQGGASLTLVAPTSGPLAGMAMVQPTVSTYIGGAIPAATHTIIGGGTINIVGIIYTPQAKIRVTGNGTINDTSTYFSIVADFVELEGNGELHINAGADAMATGLPPMPTPDDGLGGMPAQLVN